MSIHPPAAASVAPWYAAADLADAFAIDLPSGTTGDPLQLAEFVFSSQPGWIAMLMGVRDTLVRPFGIKTSRQLQAAQPAVGVRRIGLFRLFTRSECEVVLGEDDRHLDFRVSVLRQANEDPSAAQAETETPMETGAQSESGVHGGSDARLVVTTVVRCHNALGRTYLSSIRFFHRRVVIASLRHAARRGWPTSG